MGGGGRKEGAEGGREGGKRSKPHYIQDEHDAGPMEDMLLP